MIVVPKNLTGPTRNSIVICVIQQCGFLITYQEILGQNVDQMFAVLYYRKATIQVNKTTSSVLCFWSLSLMEPCCQQSTQHVSTIVQIRVFESAKRCFV